VVSAIPWDSQQRLTQVQTPELTATYRYDLSGRRVQRQITKPGQPTETTHYVYDGLQAVAEIRPPQPPPKTPDYIKYRHYSK
jgi:YD repeat-containing protein